jgi:hypothetical protein
VRVARPESCRDGLQRAEGPGRGGAQDLPSLRWLPVQLSAGVPDHLGDAHLDAVYRYETLPQQQNLLSGGGVPCTLVEIDRRFRGAYFLRHQGPSSRRLKPFMPNRPTQDPTARPHFSFVCISHYQSSHRQNLISTFSASHERRTRTVKRDGH